jgi:hypothetical protein
LGLCCPVLFRGGRDCFVLQKKSEKAEFLAWNQQHIVYLTEWYRGVIYLFIYFYLFIYCLLVSFKNLLPLFGPLLLKIQPFLIFFVKQSSPSPPFTLIHTHLNVRGSPLASRCRCPCANSKMPKFDWNDRCIHITIITIYSIRNYKSDSHTTLILCQMC